MGSSSAFGRCGTTLAARPPGRPLSRGVPERWELAWDEGSLWVAVKSGAVNILAALKWLVSQGLLKATDVPTQLEYGVEICSTDGPETFRLTGLTFSLK